MKPSKGVLIAGGVAVAGGAIWYIKKQEKEKTQQAASNEPPITAPVTYASSQEGYGNLGNFGGGGAPSSGNNPGVVTTPPPEHAPEGKPFQGCPPGTHAVGVSAVPGKPGGIYCVPSAPQPEPVVNCPTGTRKVCNMSALPGHSACHCEQIPQNQTQGKLVPL